MAPWLRVWIAVPLVVLAWMVGMALSPLLVVGAIIADVGTGSRWAALRAVLMLLAYLTCEVTGLAVIGGLWVLAGPWRTGDEERYIALNYRLQRWWSATLWAAAEFLFELDIQVEGTPSFRKRPFILFMRHAGLPDVLLPARLVANPHIVRLRYILKQELLWEPCLNIVGRRVPNYFVNRMAADGATEASQVATLMDDLHPGEGVLIFPEGTRFSEGRRGALIERYRQSDRPELADRVERHRFTLPVRPRGSLALLGADTDADAVFCAHAGFEVAHRAMNLLNGNLIGTTVKVRFWTVPAAEIPRDPEAQRTWLDDQWQRMDAEVAALQKLVHRASPEEGLVGTPMAGFPAPRDESR